MLKMLSVTVHTNKRKASVRSDTPEFMTEDMKNIFSKGLLSTYRAVVTFQSLFHCQTHKKKKLARNL